MSVQPPTGTPENGGSVHLEGRGRSRRSSNHQLNSRTVALRLAPGSHSRSFSSLQADQTSPFAFPCRPAPFPPPPTACTEMIPPNAAITVTGNLFTADSANGNVPSLFGCLQSHSWLPWVPESKALSAHRHQKRILPRLPPPTPTCFRLSI